MINITDAAAEKAKEILSAEGKAEWGLRIYTAGSSCCGPSYGMDIDEKPVEGDEVVEKNGLKVFLDKGTYERLDGMELDFIDDGERRGFILTGVPAAGGNCSTCGS